MPKITKCDSGGKVKSTTDGKILACGCRPCLWYPDSPETWDVTISGLTVQSGCTSSLKDPVCENQYATELYSLVLVSGDANGNFKLKRGNFSNFEQFKCYEHTWPFATCQWNGPIPLRYDTYANDYCPPNNVGPAYWDHPPTYLVMYMTGTHVHLQLGGHYGEDNPILFVGSSEITSGTESIIIHNQLTSGNLNRLWNPNNGSTYIFTALVGGYGGTITIKPHGSSATPREATGEPVACMGWIIPCTHAEEHANHDEQEHWHNVHAHNVHEAHEIAGATHAHNVHSRHDHTVHATHAHDVHTTHAHNVHAHNAHSHGHAPHAHGHSHEPPGTCPNDCSATCWQMGHMASYSGQNHSWQLETLYDEDACSFYNDSHGGDPWYQIAIGNYPEEGYWKAIAMGYDGDFDYSEEFTSPCTGTDDCPWSGHTWTSGYRQHSEITAGTLTIT